VDVRLFRDVSLRQSWPQINIPASTKQSCANFISDP